MKLRLFITILLCLVVGFFIGKFIIDEYKGSLNTTPVFMEKEEIYLIQFGVYSSLDSLNKNTEKLTSYVYENIDGKYHVYIGVTNSESNLEKMLSYFNKKSFSTYVKTLELSDKKFIELLKQYDLLLENTNDESIMESIIKTVLSKYEEVDDV